jgi:hypothetical protein
MKEIYSFEVKRKVQSKVPYEKEDKDGKIVEAFKTKTRTINHKVVLAKPSFSDIEDAEFFYGQKYNEYINAGYLTRLMLNKKIGDVGGSSSKLTEEIIHKAFLDNMESSKVIEFYEGQDDLDDDQIKKLEDAKDLFIESQKIVHDYEEFHRSQYSQTAEAKAEQKIIEWFIFNFSFYEDYVKDKAELFPLFVGDNFEEKRSHYLALCEDESEIENKDILKNKAIFDKAFVTLARVVNLWYNKMGSTKKEIEENLKDLFPDE